MKVLKRNAKAMLFRGRLVNADAFSCREFTVKLGDAQKTLFLIPFSKCCSVVISALGILY